MKAIKWLKILTTKKQLRKPEAETKTESAKTDVFWLINWPIFVDNNRFGPLAKNATHNTNIFRIVEPKPLSILVLMLKTYSL